MKHPGEYIKEEITRRGWLQVELAYKSGIYKTQVCNLINKKIPLTQIMATKLEKATGIPATTWMNYQIQYQNARYRS